MKTKQIKRKLNRINKQIGNTEIGKDGRYQQLTKEREQLELSFYREMEK
jgi:hypothetical protein